jgi:hypothetical protein
MRDLASAQCGFRSDGWPGWLAMVAVTTSGGIVRVEVTGQEWPRGAKAAPR